METQKSIDSNNILFADLCKLLSNVGILENNEKRLKSCLKKPSSFSKLRPERGPETSHIERKVSYACFELPNLLLKNPKDLSWLEQHEEFLQNLLAVLRSMNWVFYQARVEWAMKRVKEQREYVAAEIRLFAALQG
ncbi:7773_t:CDS:2 [Ambispora leptoticha]|uniref:7773_t:CDS:1 n=1 Tax=Ambispora leptoticha TaxID=144679 RepID=A0A9N8VNF6_9GLOM|nr:7773_t:CDS:2 [Ambispora leptoticha]